MLHHTSIQNKMSYVHRLLTALFLSLTSLTECFGQRVWHDPLQAGQASYIHGQGWDEDGGNYHRLPDRAQTKVWDKVWQLACQSAGLSIHFRTDARELSVSYQTTQPLSMPHMTSTGVSGVDLYRAGDLAFCFGSYSFGDTIRYSYRLDSASKALQGAKALASRTPAVPPKQPHSKKHPLGIAQLSSRSNDIR